MLNYISVLILVGTWVEVGGGKRKCEELVEEEKGPKVLKSRSPMVPGSKGPRVPSPKDQYISKSHSNTSLTLRKVHLVLISFYLFFMLLNANQLTPQP